MNSHNDSRHVVGLSIETDGIVVAMTYPRPHGITVCAIPCGTTQTAMPVFTPNFMRYVPGLRCAYPGLLDSFRPCRACCPVYQCCYGRDHFILRRFCGDYMGYLCRNIYFFYIVFLTNNIFSYILAVVIYRFGLPYQILKI